MNFADRAEKIIAQAIDNRLRLIDMGYSRSIVTKQQALRLLEKMDSLTTDMDYAMFLLANKDILSKMPPGTAAKIPHRDMEGLKVEAEKIIARG